MTTAAKNRKSTKKDAAKQQSNLTQYHESLRGLEWLGELVCWDQPKGGVKSKHKDVVAALATAGFDTKIAREIAPVGAFHRACKKLEADRVIDFVSDSKDLAVFQFTKKKHQAGTETSTEVSFHKETFVRIDKATGAVTCKLPDVQKQAQTLLDQAMEERTTSDITSIIKRLFSTNGELISLRRSGGVYIILNEHQETTDKVETFLSCLGTGWNLNRVPIPKGTSSGDRAITLSVSEHFAGLIEEFETTVESFNAKTRYNTIQEAAEDYKKTRVKLEAYAHYLGDKQKELLTSLAEGETRLLEKLKEVAQERRDSGNSATEDQQKAMDALTHEPQTMRQIMNKGNLKESVFNFFNALVKKGRIGKTSDCKFYLLNGEGE